MDTRETGKGGQTMKQLRNWITLLLLSGLGMLGLIPGAAQAVTVAITAPTQNQAYSAPATVALTATVSGTGVTAVDFYQGTTKIGTKTGSPYNYSWTNVGTGSYTLTAQAKNFWGTVVATSAPVTISVSAGTTVVTLTNPTANQVFPAGATIPLAATVSGSQPIAKVDYYQGAVLIATATAAPYTASWTNVAAGNYNLTAQATDSQNVVTSSTAVPVTVAAPPSIWYVNPSANQVYQAPGSVTIRAGVLSYNSTITKVDFYEGTNLIGTKSISPYEITWSNVAAGSYNLSMKVTDNLGQVVTSVVRPIIVNAAPSVSLTAPTANQSYPVGATVTLTAAAADSDGTIGKVEFYQGSTLIGTATAAPYSVTWSNVGAGNYSLTAKATDNAGGVSTSNAVAINVAALPTVSLSSPTANQIVTAPGPVTVTANAASSGGTIGKVEFYQGSTLIGTATTPPYMIAWSNIAPGSYSLTAKATDNIGLTTTSSAVTITVNAPPTISLISPSGTQTYSSGSTILLQATAADSDGTVSKVDFYQGAALLGSATTAPYSINWSNVAVGNYSLTAVATDNLGATATSDAVAIGVTDEPKFYAVYTDHLNTPRLITDEQNTPVWRWLPTTEPFGNTPPEEDPSATGNRFEFNLRFPGQYADKETGTNYNMMRDYDPSTGRYLQSDPIGLAGGINTYSYVGGNPLSMVDPYGLFGMDDINGAIYDATGGWTPSQSTVDFSAGLGDALLLGTGGYLRDMAGVDGGTVDECSDAYQYGSYAALAAGGARLTYAGLAKAGSLLAASGAEASAFRAGLKTFFRGGVGRNWRPPNLAGKTDAQLRTSAGKTNGWVNGYGAGVGAAGSKGAAQCGCSK